MAVVLLDNTVLSNFAHIERPDLLRLALPDAHTTPQVMAELQSGVTLGRLPVCDWSWLTLVELSPHEQDRLVYLQSILDDGEASCIAIAMERDCAIFSDDRDARRYARRQGLSISGTLGVLTFLIEGGHLTVAEADAHLQEMIVHGYRSPVSSLTELDNI
jgi:predicted nucleic acid-binding protein